MKKKGNVKLTACNLQCLLVTGLWALHFAFSTITYAAIAPKSAIFSGKEVTITIGLSHSYASIYSESPNLRLNCLYVEGAERRFCATYVFGNDFQLLDWLENGLIDGAVVSPLTLKFLHTSDRQPFKDHFIVARYDAFAKKSLANYHIGLSAPQSGDAQKTPLERYQGYLKGLLTDPPVPVNKITIDSHLSPALGLFLVTTNNWLKKQSSSAKQRDQFWRRLFQQTVFTLSRPTVNDTNVFSFRSAQDSRPSNTYLFSASPVRDYLILRRQAVSEIPLSKFRVLPDDETIGETYQQIVPDYLPIPKKELSLPTSLKKFINDNFTHHQMGSQVRRYFRFTIPELMHLLRSGADDTDESDIALVLTGGGVKAAYQTKLVDYLYGRAFLSNMNAGCSARITSGAQQLTVKYVIGTSGGALLGMFVAAIKKCGNPDFSKLLWFKDETRNYITFTDVFPPIDMLRWLSFLISFLIFSIVATFLYKCKWVRQHLGFDERISEANLVEDTGGRFFRFSLVWIVFLSLTPFLIRYVNGEELAEHIPEMQGFFYFVLAFIGVHTDNHIIRVDKRALEGKKEIPKRVFTWALLSGGLLLTMLSFAHRKWEIFDNIKWDIDKTWGWLERLLSWKMTTNVFLFCLGLLLLACSIHSWYFNQSRHFRSLKSSEGDVKGSYLVLLLVPVLSAAFIYIQHKADWISALELTLSFWVGLLLASIATALLIFAFAILEHSVERPKDLLKPRLCFLLSRHPNRWGLRMNRHTRILIMFSLAWGWWNIVIGPAMYGNDNSQKYINLTFNKVAKKQYEPTVHEDNAQDKRFTLQTYFVVPATSLETKSERYFLFDPYIPSVGDRRNAIKYRHQLAISSDPRWIQFSAEEQDKETLTQVAFASGSPFPVFPAHKIKIGDRIEKLIDGGYSHNTPIDAAKTLGADRLLVIYSSPLVAGTMDQPSLLQKVFGTMVQNLPRLFPYLFQRSQIEDLLSAKEVLVAALAPTGDDDGSKWPILTDFRQSVVESMLHQAERDLDRRIGTIQNWGLPEE